MSIEELEAEALRLDPKGRARLAGRLLESLDDLTPEENSQIWAEEAERRAAAAEAGRLSMRSADAVFRDARARV
jgi:Putative addiction module component